MTTILVQVLAAALGTVAFSLLFGVPSKYYGHCAAIGSAGWLLYVLLTSQAGFSPTEATFFATVLVILLSRFAAVREKCPVTVFLISGIFPLVPGAGIYWTAYYLVTGQTSLAVSSGFAAVKVAIAIVLGIVAVFELPHRMFHIGQNKQGGAA